MRFETKKHRVEIDSWFSFRSCLIGYSHCFRTEWEFHFLFGSVAIEVWNKEEYKRIVESIKKWTEETEQL